MRSTVVSAKKVVMKVGGVTSSWIIKTRRSGVVAIHMTSESLDDRIMLLETVIRSNVGGHGI
jgi:hypothetical protein